MSATGTYECLCGKCGFEVKGEPALTTYCHCKSCRIYGGDAARVAAYAPDQFKITKVNYCSRRLYVCMFITFSTLCLPNLITPSPAITNNGCAAYVFCVARARKAA